MSDDLPSSETTSSTKSTESSNKTTKSVNSFNEFKKRKSEERLGHFNGKKRKAKADELVTISIGVASFPSGEFKPIRGKSLPLKVAKSISAKPLLEEALKKRKAYNRSFRGDLTYELYYPDGSEVVSPPGCSEPFTLEKYKDDLGKTYNRISLYLSPLMEDECTAGSSGISITLNDDKDFALTDEDIELFDDIALIYSDESEFILHLYHTSSSGSFINRQCQSLSEMFFKACLHMRFSFHS